MIKKISHVFTLSLILIMMNQFKANAFKIETLSENLKEEMIDKKTWNESCPVALERLRLVKFSYYDFAGVEHNNGELVVLDAAAKQALTVFQKLYELKFPIHKARRIEHYDGNDEASMADNNSSCFNCREITGGGLPSIHAYGLAIDINPHQNPFVAPQDALIKLQILPIQDPVKAKEEGYEGSAKILPAAGLKYLNRTNLRLGMVEPIVGILRDNGFTIWGGTWNDPIDWQHFQPSRATAQLLAAMNPDDAHILFEMYAKEPSMLNAVNAKDNVFVELYKKNPGQFMGHLKANPRLMAMEPLKAYHLMQKDMK